MGFIRTRYNKTLYRGSFQQKDTLALTIYEELVISAEFVYWQGSDDKPVDIENNAISTNQ